MTLISFAWQSNQTESQDSFLGIENTPLQLVEEWEMEIDTLTAKHAIKYQYHIEDGKEYFISINPFEPSIQIYSLESSRMIDKIPLEVDGPKGIGNLLITHSNLYVEHLN